MRYWNLGGWNFTIFEYVNGGFVEDAPNTHPENEWWEGIPSELLKLWDKGVIFGVFAGDGLSRE